MYENFVNYEKYVGICIHCTARANLQYKKVKICIQLIMDCGKHEVLMGNPNKVECCHLFYGKTQKM